MKQPWIRLLAVVCVLGLAAAPARADEQVARMIDAKADAIVSVKYVLNLQLSFHGQTQDREMSGEATGVVVDPSGLVVLPGEALKPRGRGMQGLEVKAVPSNLRVVFAGDPKEYEAVLGATDSRLGLAFVRIKDLEGRVLKPVDLTQEGDVKLGDRLYGVSRLGQGFDYAPYCDTAEVIGYVTKPRKMWLLAGRFLEVSHPLFLPDGKLVGFVIQQEGVGGGPSLSFLIPLGVARSTIERAGREAERVLEEGGEGGVDTAEGDETPETPKVPDAPAAPETPSTPDE